MSDGNQTAKISAAPPRNPLLNFADRWKLDGDLIRCRECGRGQHTSWMRHAFQHRSDCKNENAEPDPWLVLARLINAQLMLARDPGEAA